jgi:hypothetical protein
MRIDDPTPEHYRTIFISVCKASNIDFNETVFVYLLRKYYDEVNRPLRACHPRDLVKQIINFAIFRNEPPAMTADLIDRAARSYFTEMF